jgi:hypothetical protein
LILSKKELVVVRRAGEIIWNRGARQARSSHAPRYELWRVLPTIFRLVPLSDLRTTLSRYSLRVWWGQALVDTVHPSRAQLKGISWLNVNINEYR